MPGLAGCVPRRMGVVGAAAPGGVQQPCGFGGSATPPDLRDRSNIKMEPTLHAVRGNVRMSRAAHFERWADNESRKTELRDKMNRGRLASVYSIGFRV